MATTAEQEFIKEHLPYELLMLRYTERRLRQNINQLEANTLIESFAIHGRNLLDFLNLKGDPKSCWAGDFCDTWSKRTLGSQLGPIYGKMHDQILHMGQKRTMQNAQKFGTAERAAVLAHVESRFKDFLSNMRAEYIWDDEAAKPEKFKMLTLKTDGGTQLLHISASAQSESSGTPQMSKTSSHPAQTFLRSKTDSDEQA